jgi:hypothetical protein
MRLDHKVNNILYIESILIARKVNKLEYNKVIRKKQVQLKITSKKRLVDKNELNECLVFNATFSNISAISWRRYCKVCFNKQCAIVCILPWLNIVFHQPYFHVFIFTQHAESNTVNLLYCLMVAVHVRVKPQLPRGD